MPLSSSLTFFVKFIFSSICVLGSALLLLTLGDWLFISHQPIGWMASISILMMSVGFLICGYHPSILKKVRLGKDEIYVSNYFREISIPLTDVIGLKESNSFGFNSIRIRFASDTRFGREIGFIPTAAYLPGNVTALSELRRLLGKAK